MFTFLLFDLFRLLRVGSMSWKQNSSGWSSSAEAATRSSPQGTASRMRSPPHSAQDALWSASSRIGPGFRFLQEDLLMLAASTDHEMLLSHLAAALKLLGKLLLPHRGVQPIIVYVVGSGALR